MYAASQPFSQASASAAEGQHRLEQRADEREPEQRPDRRRRRGRSPAASTPARGRTGARGSAPSPRRRRSRPRAPREPARASGSPRARPEPGHEQEDRADGCERELEAGLEQARRRPREQDRCAEREEVPTVVRAREQPGERRQATGDTGPHDRWLPADREHVADDRGERRRPRRDRGIPSEPGEPEHAQRRGR